ncbi:MAG TPA: SGNH/GDSL hydrolase family protein [Luteolibacter sp.]|nr:SGNH/GDSL hydrolase family protein [Luteolibacter sp.]
MKRRRFLTQGMVAAGAASIGGGTQAAAEGASSAGDYGSRRPGFKKGSRLLFQGDSITDMNWGRDQKDRNHYLGHSYVFLLAARLGVDMPELQLDFYNRGRSGHTVADLRKRWQAEAVDMKPDLLSVLIGTNDAAKEVHPDDYERDYRFILGESRKANPELRVVLMDPFVVRAGKYADEDRFSKHRALVEKYAVIVERIAKDHDAVHIKLQEVFDAAAEKVSPQHWIWDGIHPLPQGHELIARQWLSAVSG